MQGDFTPSSKLNGELPDSLIYPKYLPLQEIERGGIEYPQWMKEFYRL